MSLDMEQVQAAITILVTFGGFISPITFAIMQMIKNFSIDSKYLSLIAVLVGGIVGAVLIFSFPYLGVEGGNYVIGILGGLIGGYIATKQYDSAANQGYEKAQG